MKHKEQPAKIVGPVPTKKKLFVHYPQVILGIAAFAYMFALQTNPVLATDMWTKAETIMKAQEETAKKSSKPVLIFAVLGFAAAAASLILQILDVMGMLSF